MQKLDQTTKNAGQLFRKWVQLHFEDMVNSQESPFGETKLVDAMLSVFPTKFEVSTVDELLEKHEVFAKEKKQEFINIVKEMMKPAEEGKVKPELVETDDDAE